MYLKVFTTDLKFTPELTYWLVSCGSNVSLANISLANNNINVNIINLVNVYPSLVYIETTMQVRAFFPKNDPSNKFLPPSFPKSMSSYKKLHFGHMDGEGGGGWVFP